MERMTDEAIVRRIREGDRDAYRALVERYGPMVFSVARRYCPDPAESEDLAQEVFVRAYEGLEDFRGEARFSSWLYRIAVNRCRDWAKSPARHARSLDGLMEDGRHSGEPADADGSAGSVELLGASGFAGPDAELERSERADRLRWALGELSSDYAVPFLLKYEQEMSYAEMARMLDVTAGALKVRVHRARAQLRGLLEDRI